MAYGRCVSLTSVLKLSELAAHEVVEGGGGVLGHPPRQNFQDTPPRFRWRTTKHIPGMVAF